MDTELSTFESILKEFDPLIEINKVSNRSNISQVGEFLIFCSTIGVFGGIWKIVEFIRNKKDTYKVKMSYESQNNVLIECEINSMDKKEFDNFLVSFPPKNENTIDLKIEEEAK